MSENNPINLKQDRRQWLKTSAAVLGASALSPVSAPSKTSSGASLTPNPEETVQAGALETKAPGRFFTPQEYTFVEELSETIIPADSHSGGAKAAKVPEYIEQRVRDYEDQTKQALWHEGLRLMDSMSQHYNGKSFVDSSVEERIAVLQVLSDNEHMTELPEVEFFAELKRLTVRGYYTSKVGIHDELQYKGNRILQEFVGCDDPLPPSS
jgi:Gluconate 2-dehydrogenase subunit 3